MAYKDVQKIQQIPEKKKGLIFMAGKNTELLYAIGYDGEIEKYYVFDVRIETRVYHSYSLQRATSALNFLVNDAAKEFNEKNPYYQRLKPHIGHEIECVGYGNEDDPIDICLECKTCHEVLVSAETMDYEEAGS